MKVKDAIKWLKAYGEDKELIIAWWDEEAFDMKDDEMWSQFVEVIDSRMDWSYTHEQMELTYEVRKE